MDVSRHILVSRYIYIETGISGRSEYLILSSWWENTHVVLLCQLRFTRLSLIIITRENLSMRCIGMQVIYWWSCHHHRHRHYCYYYLVDFFSCLVLITFIWHFAPFPQLVGGVDRMKQVISLAKRPHIVVSMLKSMNLYGKWYCGLFMALKKSFSSYNI
jgi:hypothetical protein